MQEIINNEKISAISNLNILSGNKSFGFSIRKPGERGHKKDSMVMSVEVSKSEPYEEAYTFEQPTIYDYFPGVSRDIVNKAIEDRLDLLDRFFVYFVYGGNLAHPNPYGLTEKQMEYFHTTIIPRLSANIKSISQSKPRTNEASKLEEHEVNIFDFITLRKLMGVYRRNGFDLYISCNMLYIKALEGGYLNDKKYTPDEVKQILRLNDEDYSSLVNGIECIELNENVSKTLNYKMGRIYNRF